eukprot:305291-Alexandrium_andersonii.AAC.1
MCIRDSQWTVDAVDRRRAHHARGDPGAGGVGGAEREGPDRRRGRGHPGRTVGAQDGRRLPWPLRALPPARPAGA